MKNIRKALAWSILSICLGVIITGCSSDTSESVEIQEMVVDKDESNVDERSSDINLAEEVEGEVADIVDIPDKWQDNTKDIYKGAFLYIFDPPRPENLIGGGYSYRCANATGIAFGKFFFEEYKKNREVIYIADSSSDIKEIELIPEDYNLKGAVLMVGTTAGRDELVLYVFRGKAGEYFHNFAIIDREGNCIEKFETKQDLLTNAPLEMIRDGEGNIYFWSNGEDGNDIGYFVLDDEGELIWEEKTKEYFQIYFSGTADGKILMYARILNQHPQLFLLNVETKEKELIIDFEDLLGENDSRVMYATCTSDGIIYYVMSDGVYRYSEGEEPERIYLFRNHGMSVHEISGMEINEKGQIGIVFTASSGEVNYLILEPTLEQVEIVEIPFVISEAYSREYAEAIVDFNKKYPQYLVKEVAYEDEKQLKTELIAGKGQVLIDTQIINFEDNVEFWECLDGVFEKELTQQIFEEKVVDAGCINGKMYGLVTEWTMLSYVTGKEEIENWTLNQSERYLIEASDIQGVFSDQSPMLFLSLFMIRDMENSPFWNLKNNEVYLDTPEFRRILIRAKEIAQEININSTEWLERVKSGQCLGELVYINGAESLAYYNKVLGESAKYIGFPGDNGSIHYIQSGAPIAICRAATEEQKVGAGLFLKYLVSYETQKKMSELGALSIRSDVLSEYLDKIPEKENWYIDGEIFEIDIEKERIKKQFLDIYENAEPIPQLPADMKNIFQEELEPYFKGEKSVEQVCGILQNRVQLYLDERY